MLSALYRLKLQLHARSSSKCFSTSSADVLHDLFRMEEHPHRNLATTWLTQKLSFFFLAALICYSRVSSLGAHVVHLERQDDEHPASDQEI